MIRAVAPDDVRSVCRAGFLLGREHRVGLDAIQKVDRILQLQIVLFLRRHVVQRTGACVGLGIAGDVAAQGTTRRG